MQFVKAITQFGLIGKLFGGSDAADAAKESAQRQEQLTKISQDNQRAALQAEAGDLTSRRPARGRRLLIAKEGSERGLSATLGG